MIKIMKKNYGFTLIELLVVVAIIGVLSAVVISSLNTAREKARDTQRLSDLKQIQTALEMYYNDYGYYPKIYKAHTETSSDVCGGSTNWCSETATSLKQELSPYYLLPTKTGSGFDKTYYYSSTSGDNYQTYGFMIVLESNSNSVKEYSDGGYYPQYYEVGYRPKCCKDTYNDNWWIASTSYVCPDGN